MNRLITPDVDASENLIIQCDCSCGLIQFSKIKNEDKWYIYLYSTYFSKFRKAKMIDKFNGNVCVETSFLFKFIKALNEEKHSFTLVGNKIEYVININNLDDGYKSILFFKGKKLFFDLILNNKQIEAINIINDIYDKEFN